MDNLLDEARTLRRRAEERAGATEAQDLEALSPEKARRLFHELRVHQIELEMQNEELRRVQEELEGSRARYFDLYDLAPVGYCTLSERGLILETNLTAATLLGVARGVLVKQPITGFILKEDQDIYYLHRKTLFETGAPQVCALRMLRQDGTQFWARMEATATPDPDGTPVCRVVISDVTETKQVEEALQKAFDQIKTLRGIVPICSICKQIRDDQGYWNRVEVYVQQHTEADFSHSICPECARKLYPDLNLYDEDEHSELRR